jgi:hypothetical protein
MGDESEAQAKPWEAAGVSRRTWYRRKAASRTASPRRKAAAEPSATYDLSRLAALAAPPPDEIDGIAGTHATIAIRSLVSLLLGPASEAVKITAAKTILDRGYGRPTVEIGGDAAMLPFMMAPAPASFQSVSLIAEIRAEARKYAALAVVVLREIAESGSSGSAKASASKALLDRGLGTVGKARMPDEQRERPLGKKEEAARAAEAAASGLYAPRQPPRSVVQ